MVNENFQWEGEFNLEKLLHRFEKMMKGSVNAYFDAEEFEMLIDYYQSNFNHEAAKSALQFALEMHPHNHRLRLQFAKQLAADGHYMRAIELLNEIEKAEPEDADIFMAKGSVYSMMLDFSKAVSEYEKALAMVDEDEIEDLYSTIAFEYENLGSFDKALSYLFKALEITASPDQVLYEIGMCYEMANEIDQALKFYLDYIEKHPANIAAWFNLGLAFHHQEKYEKAIDAFEYVLAIDDSYVPAYINIGQGYAALEEYEKALEAFHESEIYEEAEAITLYYIGECHEKMQDYDKALQFYNTALERDEFLPDAWAGIGVIKDELGDPDKGIYYLEKALELDGLNTEFHLIIADLYIKTKRYEKAKEHFQRIEELDPQDPDLWKEYSYMYIVMGETGKAVQVLKTGLIHQPANAGLIYRLAAALILNKNVSQAYLYLETALELDYEGYAELFEFMPSLRQNPRVTELILLHMPQ